MSETTELVLTALSLPRIGRRSVVRTCQVANSGKDMTQWDVLFANHPLISVETARLEAQDQIRQAERMGICILTYLDESYPQRLRTIDDPPAAIFINGDRAALESSDAVAVVGTRDPSTYASKTARSAAKYLASLGAVIVSGLAKGCDTLAHEGCLDAAGKTIAVMAHGLDKVYPAENRALAAKILDNGGALVSEYPVGTPPQRNSFVERDRLQSGLADAVLVVETSETGGTMHTARFACKQHRTLATMEHPEQYTSDPRTEGNEQIKREMGGLPVQSKKDLEELMLTHRFELLIALVSGKLTRETAPEALGSEQLKDVMRMDPTLWAELIQGTLAHPNFSSVLERAISAQDVNDLSNSNLRMRVLRAFWLWKTEASGLQASQSTSLERRHRGHTELQVPLFEK